ncbi:MAG: MarR family winged helix-turn-helix transcriptional regulator [Sulfitobacter sp.]
MPTKPFHLSAFLPYRMAVLSERVSRRLSVEYEKTHGLSVAEWRVLVHLARCGTVSVREIHNCVNLEKSRVSRAVTRMEATGMLQKLPGAVDGRLVEISLSDAGQNALKDILPTATAVEATLRSSVPAEDMATFCRVMEKMHATLDADPDARPRSTMDVEGLED